MPEKKPHPKKTRRGGRTGKKPRDPQKPARDKPLIGTERPKLDDDPKRPQLGDDGENTKTGDFRNPLCLMPMRLEYRYFDPDSEIELMDGPATRKAGKLVRKKIKSGKAGALWFRWFPDDNFAEEGALPPTPEERSALDRFLAHPSASRYPDDRDETVGDAWALFVNEVGEDRAVHLFRHRRGIEDLETSDPALRGGHICGLPRRVCLYAMTGQKVVGLIEGADIPLDPSDGSGVVTYAASKVDAGSWISDFDMAVENGMGIRIEDPEIIDEAFNAEWILAVGLFGDEGRPEMEAFLTDAAAHGKLTFLEAETPTNNAGEERSGPTLSRRFDNENGFDQTAEGAGELLAAALGVSTRPLRDAINSAIPYKRAAAAMMRVVGPVLLDDRLDGASALEGVSEVRFIDLIAETFLARGAQAPVRIGDGAYGVVTMTASDELKTSEVEDEDLRKIMGFVQVYAQLLGPAFAKSAEEVSLRVEPGDPDAAEKLGEILKTNAGGRRIDVVEDGSDDPKPVGCPYVDGPKDSMKATQYLLDLRLEKIRTLPDPDEDERGWPLLYRLARRSLLRNTRFQIAKPTFAPNSGLPNTMDRIEGLPLGVFAQGARDAAIWAETQSLRDLSRDVSGLSQLPTARQEMIRQLSSSFGNALRVLHHIAGQEGGVSRLEALLIEVVDFLQYRLDAWALGMAHAKLMDQRKKEKQSGLDLGYFGFLGKLRAVSGTGHTDGFVQAPSPAQASAAAVMRASYLRHGRQGAMAIDHRSSAVQCGLSLLDYLRKGQTMSQALGLLGEQWLRRNDATRFTVRLRQDFPIRNPDQDGKGRAALANQSVFDGLAFARATQISNHLKDLQGAVRTAQDNLSDLITAEAVYARAIGSGERANAWLQVLAGDPIPGRPEFIRTQRPMQTSDHRVSLWLADAPDPGGDILARGEPALLALAQDILPDSRELEVVLTVRDIKSGKAMEQIPMPLIGKIYFGLAEVMMSDAAALRRRTLSYVQHVSGIGEKLQLRMGGKALGAQSDLSFDLALMPFDETPDAFFARIAPVVRMIRRARPLEPNDLAPIALTAGPLSEDIAMKLWSEAASELSGRVSHLTTTLKKAHETLRVAREKLVDYVAENFIKWKVGTGVDRVRDAEGAALVDEMNAAIWRMRSLLPGEVLPLETLEEWLADLEGEEVRVLKLQTTLAERYKAAMAVTPDPELAPDSLDVARAAAQGARQAIRHLLGRDRLPVFPRFPRWDEMEPDVRDEHDIAAGLEEWPQLRKRLTGPLALSGLSPDWRLWEGVDRATEIPPDDDPRGEDEAPLLHHFGKVIARAETLEKEKTLQGIVIDEWTESRPSMIQPAALALNYDSPQAEAPNAILLGVPPSLEGGPWTTDSAANLVQELITWTKIRTATTQNTALPTTVLPGSNLVGQKRVDGEWVNRIPEGGKFLSTRPAHKISGTFESGDKALGLAASGLREILGSGSKRGGQ